MSVGKRSEPAGSNKRGGMLRDNAAARGVCVVACRAPATATLALLRLRSRREREDKKNDHVTHKYQLRSLRSERGELRQVATRGQLHVFWRHVADVTPGNHVQRSIAGWHERGLWFPGRWRRFDGRLPRRHFNFDDVRTGRSMIDDLAGTSTDTDFHRIRLQHINDLRAAEPRPLMIVVEPRPHHVTLLPRRQLLPLPRRHLRAFPRRYARLFPRRAQPD